MEAQEITLRLRCRELPGSRFGERSGVRLGVQKAAEVVDDVAADADEAVFTFPVRFVARSRTGAPDFGGPFVHGRPGARFVYLCWGERAPGGGEWDGFRRAKVSLNALDRVAVDAALRTGAPLEALLIMTDARGGPVCASYPAGDIRWTRAR